MDALGWPRASSYARVAWGVMAMSAQGSLRDSMSGCVCVCVGASAPECL